MYAGDAPIAVPGIVFNTYVNKERSFAIWPPSLSVGYRFRYLCQRMTGLYGGFSLYAGYRFRYL